MAYTKNFFLCNKLKAPSIRMLPLYVILGKIIEMILPRKYNCLLKY